MSEDQIAQFVREGLYLVLLVSAPAVAASLIIGIAVSLLQTATQLQDQTLTFVPKLVVVMLTLAVAGPWAGAQLVRFARAVVGGIAMIKW
jgi:flagellar biosynthetic protein FliQ